MRTTIAATLITALALLTACGTQHAPQPSPSVSAAAHTAEMRGLDIIEHCTPNGQAMIVPVFNGTATGQTYLQVFRFFKSAKHRATVWTCAGKKAGAANIPGAKPSTLIEDCFAKSAAVTAVVQHPFRSAHHVKATAQSLLTAAAVCTGNNI